MGASPSIAAVSEPTLEQPYDEPEQDGPVVVVQDEWFDPRNAPLETVVEGGSAEEGGTDMRSEAVSCAISPSSARESDCSLPGRVLASAPLKRTASPNPHSQCSSALGPTPESPRADPTGPLVTSASFSLVHVGESPSAEGRSLPPPSPAGTVGSPRASGGAAQFPHSPRSGANQIQPPGAALPRRSGLSGQPAPARTGGSRSRMGPAAGSSSASAAGTGSGSDRSPYGLPHSVALSSPPLSRTVKSTAATAPSSSSSSSSSARSSSGHPDARTAPESGADDYDADFTDADAGAGANVGPRSGSDAAASPPARPLVQSQAQTRAQAQVRGSSQNNTLTQTQRASGGSRADGDTSRSRDRALVRTRPSTSSGAAGAASSSPSSTALVVVDDSVTVSALVPASDAPVRADPAPAAVERARLAADREALAAHRASLTARAGDLNAQVHQVDRLYTVQLAAEADAADAAAAQLSAQRADYAAACVRMGVLMDELAGRKDLLLQKRWEAMDRERQRTRRTQSRHAHAHSGADAHGSFSGLPQSARGSGSAYGSALTDAPPGSVGGVPAGSQARPGSPARDRLQRRVEENRRALEDQSESRRAAVEARQRQIDAQAAEARAATAARVEEERRERARRAAAAERARAEVEAGRRRVKECEFARREALRLQAGERKEQLLLQRTQTLADQRHEEYCESDEEVAEELPALNQAYSMVVRNAAAVGPAPMPLRAVTAIPGAREHSASDTDCAGAHAGAHIPEPALPPAQVPALATATGDEAAYEDRLDADEPSAGALVEVSTAAAAAPAPAEQGESAAAHAPVAAARASKPFSNTAPGGLPPSVHRNSSREETPGAIAAAAGLAPSHREGSTPAGSLRSVRAAAAATGAAVAASISPAVPITDPKNPNYRSPYETTLPPAWAMAPPRAAGSGPAPTPYGGGPASSRGSSSFRGGILNPSASQHLAAATATYQSGPAHPHSYGVAALAPASEQRGPARGTSLWDRLHRDPLVKASSVTAAVAAARSSAAANGTGCQGARPSSAAAVGPLTPQQSPLPQQKQQQQQQQQQQPAAASAGIDGDYEGDFELAEGAAPVSLSALAPASARAPVRAETAQTLPLNSGPVWLRRDAVEGRPKHLQRRLLLEAKLALYNHTQAQAKQSLAARRVDEAAQQRAERAQQHAELVARRSEDARRRKEEADKESQQRLVDTTAAKLADAQRAREEGLAAQQRRNREWAAAHERRVAQAQDAAAEVFQARIERAETRRVGRSELQSELSAVMRREQELLRGMRQRERERKAVSVRAAQTRSDAQSLSEKHSALLRKIALLERALQVEPGAPVGPAAAAGTGPSAASSRAHSRMARRQASYEPYADEGFEGQQERGSRAGTGGRATENTYEDEYGPGEQHFDDGGNPDAHVAPHEPGAAEGGDYADDFAAAA